MGTSVQPAALEPDRLRFESAVVTRNGRTIELDETYFFAESGGQPSDRGTLAGLDVVDVRHEGGATVHELAGEPDVAVGDVVEGVVDETFRTYCRRAHTASHVVYGAARRELDGLGYGGFAIDDRKVRVDLSSEGPVDESTLMRVEQLANEAVWEGREVTWYQLPSDEARADDRIAFNVATEEGVFADNADVRIVEIDGWDIAACGGTHLQSTAEIGPIRMLDRSNPGEGLTRVEFAVGPAAIEHQARVHGDARAAARKLDVRAGELADAVADRLAEAAALSDRVEALERRLLEERLSGLAAEAIERDGTRWVVGEVPSVDASAATAVLRERVETDAIDAIVAVSGDDRSTIVVAATDAVDAGGIIADVTGTLGGGGGGGSDLAQGGGIPARPDAVVAHVREEVIGDRRA